MQLSGHGRDAGAATGSQAGANPPDGAAAPTGTLPAPAVELPWEGSAGGAGGAQAPGGSRQQPTLLPGEISPWFHHPLPALKEKFLLHARGKQPPLEGWGAAGAALGPQPRRAPPAPVCSGLSRSCHVCTEGARQQQLAEPRCHSLGLSPAALGAARAHAGGLGGSPGPDTDVPPDTQMSPPHPSPARTLLALLPHSLCCARVSPSPCAHF